MTISKNGLSKRCSHCKLWKKLDNFGKRSASPDGYRSRCKRCMDSDRKAKAPTKHCKRCDKFKARDNFHRNKSRKDGLATYCKQCMNVIAAEYRPTHECTDCDTRYSFIKHPNHLYCPACTSRRERAK